MEKDLSIFLTQKANTDLRNAEEGAGDLTAFRQGSIIKYVNGTFYTGHHL